METTLGFPEQLKVEMDSPPPSPRGSDDDDDETEPEPEDSDGEEEESGDGVGTGGAALVSGGPPLKKGPWTPDEDKRLKTYVEAHGEGNWNRVQRNAGLNRCGKSCRLRWANHLRPHLKKGPFSEAEEQRIIELHAKYGNKWARMAAELPGRTDNEIKNFWNTRKKRRDKVGLGLYPDGLLSRVQNQDKDSHSPDGSHGKKRPNDLSQGTGLVFDDIVFEKLDYKKRLENFLAPTFRNQDSLPSESMNPLKRHASSDMVSDYGVSSTCERFPHETEKTPYTDSYPVVNQSVPFNNVIANGPPILDGNFSTLGAIQRPIKMELPSFQNTVYGSVNSMSHHICPGPPVELSDTFIPSSASVLMKSGYLASQNNSLLDPIVQGHGPCDPTKFQGAYEASVPTVPHSYPLSPHSSTFDSFLEDNPLDEFRTSKSSTSVDALLADNYFSALQVPCMHDASKARHLNEDSPHSEHQPINHSVGMMFYGDPFDQVMLSATGDGHPYGLESVPWNSMPGTYQMSETSNVSQQQL